ncbi:MAG: hypothetical protein N2Z67_04865 [Acetobacteraceae bacterium]|nr:hypothetical protein [Acetobacteraceae bacterium]
MEAAARETSAIFPARDAAALDRLVRERLFAAAGPFTEAGGAIFDAEVSAADGGARARRLPAALGASAGRR